MLHVRNANTLASQAGTFWLPADAKPSTLLEKLVKSIFDFHAKDLPRQRDHPDQRLSSDATPRSHLSPENSDGIKHALASLAGKQQCRGSSSARGFPRGGTLRDETQGTFPKTGHSDAEPGAEWWVQVREEGHHSHLGMPFHWDKDEKLMEEEGVVVCPAISTVTYLTEFGAPTTVLEVGDSYVDGFHVHRHHRAASQVPAFLSVTRCLSRVSHYTENARYNVLAAYRIPGHGIRDGCVYEGAFAFCRFPPLPCAISRFGPSAVERLASVTRFCVV